MRVASFIVSSPEMLDCFAFAFGYRVPPFPPRHPVSRAPGRCHPGLRLCRPSRARISFTNAWRDADEPGPTPNEETGHVRDVAVFTADDPRRRAAQPHRGAADAPILRGQGISYRLASDECR